MSRKYRFLSVLSASAPLRSCCVMWASKTHQVRRRGVTLGSHSRTVPMHPGLSMALAKADFSTSPSSSSCRSPCGLLAKVSHQYVTEEAAWRCRERACNCSMRTVKLKGVPHQWETIHIGGCSLPCATTSTNEHLLILVKGMMKWSRTWYIVKSSQVTLLPRVPPSEPAAVSTRSCFIKVSWMKSCSSKICSKLTPRMALSAIGL
mmetsp:Transcript_5429/g.17057  ORF Transcript_5429/g.17057 Transcript_5429/m.17057 type:complete len:205 (-) Transcript_5429:165-779(-)